MPSGQLSMSNSSDQRFVSTDHSLTDPTPHPLDHCSNHSLRDTPFAIEQYADIVCGGLTINSKPCVVITVNILQAVPYNSDVGWRQISKTRLEIEPVNISMVDALSYSYKPPSSVTSPDCDGQDGNMDMLHLSHRNIDARGGIFNDVGQNQYNCFVVNQYFTLNMQEPGDPDGEDVYMELEEQQDQLLMDLSP